MDHAEFPKKLILEEKKKKKKSPVELLNQSRAQSHWSV